MKLVWTGIAAGLLVNTPAAAALAEAPAIEVAPQPIEEILVTGHQPGPGLCKVTRPADGNGHVLWILGTHGPLPKKMQWRSAELEAALAESQQLIGPVAMRADVGPLGGVTLLPSLRVRRWACGSIAVTAAPSFRSMPFSAQNFSGRIMIRSKPLSPARYSFDSGGRS